MQPYPRAPDLVWPGHLHGSGCLSARAVGTGFPTVGLRLWLGPGCGWSWVLFTLACCRWGLGWVCLGSVCGVVPLLPAVCAVRGWALVSACFRDLCRFVRVSLAPPRFRFRCAVWACVLGPGFVLPHPSWLGCRVVLFALFFFPVAGCPCPGGPCGLSPRLLSFGLGCWLFFFFFFSACFGAPFPGGPLFLAWCCRFWLGGPPVPVWGSCLRCPLGGGFGPLLCCWRAVWWLWAVFARPAAPSFFFFFGGGGLACLAVAPFAFLRLALALWLVCGVVGPSPLPAEVPVCYSPPLLAGFRCRWWWAVPATPGWGLPAAVVCDVWRWCVGGVVAGVWCGWSLPTPGGGSCVLLPATPGWVSLPLVVGSPRHSWLGSACGGGVWCVVCGSGVLVGLWLVCGVVGPSPLLAEVPVCYSPPLLAGFRCRWWWAVPATPGWGPLAAVVCGVWCVAVVCWWGCGWCVVWLVPRHSWRRFLCATPRHSWLAFAAAGGGRSPPLLAGVRWRRRCVVCGGGVLLGLWLVCGLVGPSPLLAEVPVCYSPPLLAGFRCRWWWAVPATPGWGPLAAVVCGVWCVVCGVLLGSLATPGGGSCVLLPATPGWVSLPLVVGGPRHSWLGSAGGVGVWCVAVVCCWGCGWCVVWLVPRHSWRRFLCATPRHSWLGFAAGGGGRSPPLLAGVRWRRRCVVCGGGVLLGLWLVCGVVGPSPLLAEGPVCYSPPLLAGFRCRLWWAVPATPGWGPLAAVVCGVWCVVGVPRHSWRRFLCATPRHSWLGFAAAGGGRSPPLLAGVRWRRWCACFAWPGRAGRPPGRVVVRLTCSFGRFVLLLCLAPSGLRLPLSLSLLLPFLVGWGLWCVGWLLPGTCSCAVVRCVLCAPSGFVAPGGRRCLAPVRVPWLWPAACLSGVPRGPAWCAAPRPVRSLSVLRSAFPTPWCLSPPRELAPPALLGGCAGHAEAGREPGSLCLPLAPAKAGALGSLRVVPVRGPAMGLSLAGPSGVGLGLRALQWLACVDPVTDASGFPYRLSFDGGLGRCTGAVSCGRRHLRLRVGGRHARVPCVFACACSSWPGRAGRPPGRVLVRLTFFFGRFVVLLCLAPSGLGLPLSLSLLLPFLVGCFSRPPAAWLAPRLCLPLGRWLLLGGCSPPLCVSRFSSLLLVALVFFFFFFLCALPLSPAFSGFRPRVPRASALALFVLLAFRFTALRALVPLSCFPPGCWLLPRGCCPPPPLCLAVFVPAARCCVPCCAVCPWVQHHALSARRRPQPPQGPPHKHRKRTKARPQRPGLGTETPRGHRTKAQAPREGNPHGPSRDRPTRPTSPSGTPKPPQHGPSETPAPNRTPQPPASHTPGRTPHHDTGQADLH